jgi:predicted membrane-bound spermidine synthase
VVQTAYPEESLISPWSASLIVFLSSGAIMVLELVAGRLMAPVLGVSLYTWTSIIGVILAGISLGNYIGGMLADRFASRGTLVVL